MSKALRGLYELDRVHTQFLDAIRFVIAFMSTLRVFVVTSFKKQFEIISLIISLYQTILKSLSLLNFAFPFLVQNECSYRFTAKCFLQFIFGAIFVSYRLIAVRNMSITHMPFSSLTLLRHVSSYTNNDVLHNLTPTELRPYW